MMLNRRQFNVDSVLSLAKIVLTEGIKDLGFPQRFLFKDSPFEKVL